MQGLNTRQRSPQQEIDILDHVSTLSNNLHACADTLTANRKAKTLTLFVNDNFRDAIKKGVRAAKEHGLLSRSKIEQRAVCKILLKQLTQDTAWLYHASVSPDLITELCASVDSLQQKLLSVSSAKTELANAGNNQVAINRMADGDSGNRNDVGNIFEHCARSSMSKTESKVIVAHKERVTEKKAIQAVSEIVGEVSPSGIISPIAEYEQKANIKTIARRAEWFPPSLLDHEDPNEVLSSVGHEFQRRITNGEQGKMFHLYQTIVNIYVGERKVFSWRRSLSATDLLTYVDQ